MFFAYKSFLGYHRGADGKPEIDPEQANTVRRIYDRFLAGGQPAADRKRPDCGRHSDAHEQNGMAGQRRAIDPF